MKNREIFQRDPVASKLLNNGIATVTEGTTPVEIETLRYELEHFVCEGQYKRGLTRILESYLGNTDSTNQPAAWVSGFFGSGKSHLLKMLRHLWVNTRFESDGATARELARLPAEVKDFLRELDMVGKRCGGLHAAAGTLPSGGGKSLRLAVLGVIFRSKGLPESLPQAQFCMWLQRNNIYSQVRRAVEDSGKNFWRELRHLYASPVLAKALLEADPDFASDLKQVRATILSQFPGVDDITTSEFIQIIRDVLSVDGELPCTAIILDEIQFFIGDSADRSYEVQEVAEALCKQLDSRILLIGAGQTALSGDLPLLQRLKDRFTIPVELSDTDVETVTRRVVLAKKADKRKAIEEMLSAYSGEIDRHLVGTRIAPRSEDRRTIVEDYPLLPVRHRFWEHVLRAVDVPGTSSQLRTQLRIVHDAVQDIAEKPLGAVVPADVIFDQLQPDLLRTGVLLREIDETIRNLDDGTPEGVLAKRICALIFLIRKLPREAVADIGVRTTADMLADLLVSDLASDGPVFRKEIPRILEDLVETGTLIRLDENYGLQTRESSEWSREFRNRQTRLSNDLTALSSKRSALLNSACMDALSSIRLLQGESKVPRKLAIHFGSELPETKSYEIPVWIRDGWGETESTVVADARASGSDSPIVFIFVPKVSAEDLKKAIIEYEAAKTTIEFKGTPTTPEGKEARDAMSTRMKMAEVNRDSIIQDLISMAKVFQGGGQERFEPAMEQKVQSAAEASLDRLFPNFRDADDHRWPTVINRARNGDETAFQAVGWNDTSEKHPVCFAVLSEVGAGKTGKQIRETFEKAPYGWPRDAIDATLITLHATRHLIAIHKGVQLDLGQLDQSKIPVTDFRVETVTIDARNRIKLRKLFQSASLSCKSGEESSVAGQFLAKLMDLADCAGGNPPMPERPSKRHLEVIRDRAGNEQLAAMLEDFDILSQQLQDWSRSAELATKRKPVWDRLQILLRHASSISEAEELQEQINAVYNERRLLDAIDPVPDICRAVAKILRTAIRQAYDNFKTSYDRERAALEEKESWQRLSLEQQQRILVDEGIASVPRLSIEEDDSLFRNLQETPLSSWKTKIDALPQQFSNAAMAASKLLEPRTQKVKLTSRILRTETDVKDWVAKTERELLEKIKSGPIVI